MKKTIKILFKIIKNFLYLLVIAIGIYMLAALVLSIIKTIPEEFDCTNEYDVFVTTNGVHLDIIVPVDYFDAKFVSQLNLLRGTEYISFGWGDKEFYINTPEWSDLTFKTAFKALFLKSQSAMHVTCYKQSYQTWRKVSICNEQLNVLTNYISGSFKTGEKGKIQKVNIDGYGHNDTFYDSKGSFSIFKTCNIWVNKALKKTGIKTSVWSPFDFGILHHLPE